MKINYGIYLFLYILILIAMQHMVWHLSANNYFLIMVIYFIVAFLTRAFLNKKNKEKGD